MATEALTSAAASTRSDSHHLIVSSPTPSFTVAPRPTSRAIQDFIYVEYDDYGDYSSYEDSVISSETHDIVLTPTTTTTTRHPRKTAPAHYFKRKTTSPTKPPAAVAMVTVASHTPSPVRTLAVLELSTAGPADLSDIITATDPGGQSSSPRISRMGTDPPPTSSPSFVPLPKKENNSVDEVGYRIVGVDTDATRGQQNFVPRMPPFRERTQNKRIQELLNEKRRQDLLRRSRKDRTDSKQTVQQKTA